MNYAEKWDLWESRTEKERAAIRDIANISTELRFLVDPTIIERLAIAAGDLGWVDDEFADEEE